MARIYAPNNNFNVDYGVDFFHGAAAVPDTAKATIEWYKNKGYEIVEGSSALTPWDYLPFEQLAEFAPYAGIDPSEMTKGELVTAIETALITLMKIDIEEFDAIAAVDAGVAGDALFADASEVQAVLPDEVQATFANGIVATVPVTAWVDTDTYNAAAAASYTFTATLGDVPTPFVTEVTATVEVVVAAE